MTCALAAVFALNLLATTDFAAALFAITFWAVLLAMTDFAAALLAITPLAAALFATTGEMVELVAIIAFFAAVRLLIKDFFWIDMFPPSNVVFSIAG
jgi:hypothetical protein